MMNTRTAICLLLLVGATGCQKGFRAEDEFSFNVPWEGFQRILIETRNGAVDLARGEDVGVSLHGEKSVRGATPQAAREALEDVRVVAGPSETQPGTLHIRIEYPEQLKSRSPSARLHVRVPQASAAQIHTSNGAVTVAGMLALDVSTSNGAISVRKCTGDLVADTSNGAVSVEDVTGNCRIDTSNGRVRAVNVSGGLDVSTSNGGITVIGPNHTGDLTARSSNGSIKLDLPKSLAADVQVETSNGGVHVDTGGAQVAEQTKSRRSYRAKINGGGHRVVARTSNGRVSLTFQ